MPMDIIGLETGLTEYAVLGLPHKIVYHGLPLTYLFVKILIVLK